MAETLLDELKRYVHFGDADEAALRALHPVAEPHFRAIAELFYARILSHDEARKALEGGESQVGRLKGTLVGWMDRLLSGPWDDEYFQLRCRIGRMHVRIALPQHYMFGAMNVLRQELKSVIDQHLTGDHAAVDAARLAVGKALDIELAIMLHTYREDLLAQQARAERLATFGQLVGSIGHELRNPLGVIETSLFILKGRLGQDERALKHTDRIQEQLRIANGIITDLLDLIRDRPLTKESLLFAPLIASILETAHHPPGVRFVVKDVESLPAVSGDSGQLRQVMVNLIDNAIHAASPEGEVRISGRTEGTKVAVAVEDTGVGVDPSIRKRLFEPLITTKVKGIGLGLALVKRIVERHEGSIRYESEPGTGARFVVRLPTA